MEKTDILIIGGCASGMSAAASARREDKNLKITVLEKGRFISYGSCAIPHYISGIIPDYKALVHHTPEEFIKERNIDVRIYCEATNIDTQNKIVTYNENSIEKQIQYDKLLIATGASPFDPFGVSNKYDNLFVCRNVDDAINIKQKSDELIGKKALILGSGYIGLEIAAAFKEKGINVTVFERDNVILKNYVSEIQEYVSEYLNEMGINIKLSENVKDFIPDGKSIKKIITDKGEYNADIIILAIGAKPSTGFLKNTDIKLGKFGEIIINRSMETNVRDVWASGDCAGTFNVITDEYTYFPLAQIANKQGKIAGINMATGKNLELKGVVKSQAMKLFDLELGGVGLTEEEAKSKGFDYEIKTITSFTKAYKHLGGTKIKVSVIFDKKTGVILGAQVAGGEGSALRINFFSIAIYNNMTLEDFWNVDLVYVPPVAPVYDPTLVAVRSAMGKR